MIGHPWTPVKFKCVVGNRGIRWGGIWPFSLQKPTIFFVTDPTLGLGILLLTYLNWVGFGLKWEVYGFEDPIKAIKNLQQTGSVRNYQAQFGRLLTGVKLSNRNGNSFFLGGWSLNWISLFKSKHLRTSMQDYKITKLQKEVFEAQAQSWGTRPSGKNQNPILSNPLKFQNYQRLFPIFMTIHSRNLLNYPITDPIDSKMALMVGNCSLRKWMRKGQKDCFLCDEK